MGRLGWGKVLCAAMLFLLPRILCAEGQHHHFFSLDAGIYGTNLDKRFSAPSGYASQVSFLTGFLRVRDDIFLGRRFYLEPAIGTLIPWETGQDGSAKTFFTHFDLPLAVPLFHFLHFRMGPGIEWILNRTSGAAIVLNNGTSQATFYLPGRTTSVFLVTLEGGFLVRLSRKFSLNLDCYVLDAFSHLRRRFDGAITLGLRL